MFSFEILQIRSSIHRSTLDVKEDESVCIRCRCCAVVDEIEGTFTSHPAAAEI